MSSGRRTQPAQRTGADMSTREIQVQACRAFEATCAMVSVTPPDEAYMHTYYDVCPWSPSGRFLACLRLPFEDHHPESEATAEVCVIDLRERTIRSLYATSGWGFQTAAKQQWGRTDRFLYFNDKRDGAPVGVRYDLQTDEVKRFDGPIWKISPDETYAICPCLIRANLTQPGYGVSVAPERQVANSETATADDGFFRVDLNTGRNELLVGLADVWAAAPNREDLADKILYAFHVKINPQGTRLMLVARAKPEQGKYHPMLLTCRPDGADLRVVLPTWRWREAPHANHPAWTPDGDQILMNVGVEGERRFVLIDAITGQIETLIDDPPGGGHPTITPDGRFLVTDAYGPFVDPQTGFVRWIDLQERRWRDLCAMPRPLFDPSKPFGTSFRVDLHPAQDRTGKHVCFTGAPTGKRRIFIADPALPPGAIPELG